MAKSKIDAQEFMLQYGDRIGLGVAGFLAFLFVLFAILGGGGGVSAEQVKESSRKADEAIRRSEVNPEKIALKDEASVKPLNQIDELSKALTKPIAMDQLTLPARFFAGDPLTGKFRSNPNVLQPLEVTAVPLVGAMRLYETRVVNKVEEAMVVSPRDGQKAPKLGNNGNNQFSRGSSSNMSGGTTGGSGKGGPGTGAGAGAGVGPGGGMGLPGDGGRSKGSSGQAGTGNSKAASKPPPAGNPGADETAFIFDWRKDIKDSDNLGVTIRPLRSAYIAATYPHAKQTDEIAKKLQIQKHEVERLYRRIDVQRRRIIPVGSPMPDGTLAAVDMVELENPKDRSKKEYKPLADVDKQAAGVMDDQVGEKERYAQAGWTDVNIPNVAAVMMSAYSVARSSGEGFYTEKEPIIEGLIEYGGPRIAMRLPKLARSEYPDVMSKLPILMGQVKKIKEDEKAKIPPPPRDSRLNSAAGEEFDKLAGYDDQNKPGDKKSNDAPEVSGPIPEYIPIRFIDVDLPTDSVGGSTFQYRIRVVLNNPNWKREKDVAAPEFAREEVLNGPWSPVTQVTFEPDSLVFAGERERARGASDDREKDKVPVQLHKWLGKVDVLGSSDRDYALVGDWWIERLLIGRGEYIGRSPDLTTAAGESNLVQWVSYAYDSVLQRIGGDVQKKTRTPDLYTTSILVDFQGGAYHSFRSEVAKGTKRDDVPAELLILEPDGRLIARHLSDDRNEEGRKQRYDHWKSWVDKLAKPTDKKAVAAGN